MTGRCPATAFAAVAIAVLFGSAPSAAQPEPPAPRYLFSWVGDLDRKESDFLAVIDLEPRGGRYGEVVATLPVGERGLWPHHTEHRLHPSRTLFANGFAGNRTLIFDLGDPLRPKVRARIGAVGELSHPHSFERAPNGSVVAALQGSGPRNEKPGGLARISSDGRVERWASAASPDADSETLRPYSLAVVPALDRIVVGLQVMAIPEWGAASASVVGEGLGNQIQVWRLSDLSLVKTLRLPEAWGPNEPRLLADGKTVLVSTVSCHLLMVLGLGSGDPSVRVVYAQGRGRCAGPVVLGSYWIQSNAGTREVVALDVRNPLRPRHVSSLSFDERQRPHWLASDGEKIVVVNEPFAEARLWMLRFDRDTGQLRLDDAFRDADADRPGLSFDRAQWPHGVTGRAVPHGTVFDLGHR